jgi:hypothetical protein
MDRGYRARGAERGEGSEEMGGLIRLNKAGPEFPCIALPGHRKFNSLPERRKKYVDFKSFSIFFFFSLRQSPLTVYDIANLNILQLV